MVSLDPQDVLFFQNYLKKDLNLLFQSKDIILLPANSAPGLFTPMLTEDKMKEVLSGSFPVVDRANNSVLLPLIWQNEPLGLAILKEVAGTFDKKILSEQWPKLSQVILEKVQLYKAYFRDGNILATEVFKDTLLDLIKACLKGEGNKAPSVRDSITTSPGNFSIIFLELLPKTSKAYPGHKQLPPLTADAETDDRDDFWKTVVAAIKNRLSGIGFTYLFRINRSTLAIIIPSCDIDKGRNIARLVLKTIKKSCFIADKVSRFRWNIAVGLLFYPSNGKKEHGLEKLYDLLIEKGRETLAVARSRPIYPICLSSEIDQNIGLKMVKHIHMVVDNLRKKWGKIGNFSLILTKYDAQSGKDHHRPSWNKIQSWLSAEQSIVSCTGDYGFLFLPKTNPEEALIVGRNLQHQIKEKCGQTVSMGLASYPLLRYKKEDVPFNAYKALVHTGFFGPDTITPFDAVSLNISGDMFFNGGHIHAAIMEYRKGLSLDRQNVNLLNSLGVCYAQLKYCKRAISCFEETLAIDKDSFMARYNLGSVYLKAGMPDKALPALEQAASLNGNHFDVLFQLGKLSQEQKRWVDAINYFQKAARCPDAKGYIYRFIGESSLALNLKKESMAAFKKAVKVNPADAFSFSRLGVLYAELKNDLEIAHVLCQKALEMDSQSGLCWKTMGQVHYLKNDYPQAIYHLKEAQLRTKNDPEIHYYLGLVYEKMGKVSEARKKWQNALKIDHSFKEAQEALQSTAATDK